ncbi:MAG: TIGR02757 family protein [Solitalea sp.]
MVIVDGLRNFLDAKVDQFNQPGFIADDPVCIPHLFTRQQDIEIMGLWAAVLAWGQRKTIIAKCRQLIELMDGVPYEFITGHEESDLTGFLSFKHRTFNATDALYFIAFFRQHYAEYGSLEEAFTEPLNAGLTDIPSPVPTRVSRPVSSPVSGREPVEKYLNNFSRRFFSLPDFPRRTMKHIPAPERNSACKRLNMFLRWMVRNDHKGVDFGLWKKISPHQLICPCDVHVERVARKLGLIQRPGGGWRTALELTLNLRKLDPDDPVKYDFALFGMGVTGEI